ncbi:MAG: CGNR zinc finger domain-containing protein [Dehalococcoidales bacterium]|nr:CGNR zinc finger domain-containing protein [Dehalococcoidales bacterium]
MWQDMYVSGEVSKRWEWGLKETPEEWWEEHGVKNPDYEPVLLDMEEGMRIYGPGFKDYKEGYLEDTTDPYADYLGFYPFIRNYFGDDYKRLLVPIGVKWPKKNDPEYRITPLGHAVDSSYYDPMSENPNIYLEYCYLSQLVYQGRSSTQVIKRVINFVNKYGPPWFNPPLIPFLKVNLPPFHDPPNCPLTINHILWESNRMASAVKAYKLLGDADSHQKLREHLTELFELQEKYHEYHYFLVEEPNKFVRTEEDANWLHNKRNNIVTDIRNYSPSLGSNKGVEHAAIALVVGSINDAFRRTGLSTGLTNKLSTNSLMGVWLPAYLADGLLGTMWLQFFQHIIDNGKLRECANENCRKFFSPSRKNQQYCSKSCGVSQYMRDNPRRRSA